MRVRFPFPSSPAARRSLTLATATLVAAATMSTPASAQGGLLGGLKKRAADAVEQKATDRVNQKIDEAAQKLVDKSFDSMFGSASGGSGGKRGGFSLLPNAPTEPSYEFDAALVYEIESMPKGKPSGEIALVTMLFNRDGLYSGTKLSPEQRKKGEGEIFAIFDQKNESMVMLLESDKEKMSMAYSWKDAKRYAESSANTSTSGAPTTVLTPDAKTITFTSLGKRKIAGYSAEGYKGASEDGDVEVWVTRESGLPAGRMMGPATSMRQMRGVMPGSYPTGLLLEVHSTDRKSGDQGRMTIRSVDTKAKTRIDMRDYPRLGASK